MSTANILLQNKPNIAKDTAPPHILIVQPRETIISVFSLGNLK